MIIEVRNIKKYFRKKTSFFRMTKEPVRAVDGVTFSVKKASGFGLVGESGCGKSTLAKLLVGILEPDSGEKSVRGSVDIVFQDPFGSLNPRMKVSHIVGEPLFVRRVPAGQIEQRTREILRMVRLDDAACMDKFPHQFSGGERQRIAIARAIIRKPDILVLDEPVSSLDVSIQAGILNLLKDLQEDLKLTLIFISHDLRVVEFMSDQVAVMKEGKFVEVASREEIYTSPKQEYTRQLLSSIPEI